MRHLSLVERALHDNKRFTVSRPLLNEQAAQDQLRGKVALRSHSHLTLVHIGKLRSLYVELQEQCHSLNEAAYCEGVLSWATSALQLNSQPTVARVLGTDVFEWDGARSYVLRLELDDEVLQARELTFDGWLSVLASFGVKRPWDFVRGSRAISLPDTTWNPHMTVESIERNLEPTALYSLTFGPAETTPEVLQ